MQISNVGVFILIKLCESDHTSMSKSANMTTIQNLAPKINIKTLYKHVRILKINGFLEYGAKVGKEKNYYVTDAGVTIAMQFSKQ